METNDVVCVSACRTAMGRFGGQLKDMDVRELGRISMKGALDRVGISGDIIDEVIVGHCRQAGNGPNPAKISSALSGIPQEVPAVTINCACPSGLKAAILAAQCVMTGERDAVMVAGMESMSTIPYLLTNARWNGFRMGDKVLLDGWNDTRDVVCNMMMGETAENLVEKYGISRQEQDEYALQSHQKAAKACDEGWLDDEIVPVSIPGSRKGPAKIFNKDEPIRRDTTLEKLSSLPAVFKENGSVTAGNSCGLSDGASSMILMSRSKAQDLGLQPLFRVLGHSFVGVENAYMGDGPSVAIPKALEICGLQLDDVDLIEVNEAFACQVIANERVLSWDRAKVNVHGGAIALGHPTGESGVRILVTLYHALKRLGKELGVASICGGTGVAGAMVIQTEN